MRHPIKPPSLPDPESGTYVRAYVEERDALALHAWCRDMGIAHPRAAQGMHATILYSRTTARDAHAIVSGYEAKILSSKPLSGSLMLFDSPGHPDARSLVLGISSPELLALHQMLLDAGGAGDYPEFKPHLTLSKLAAPDFDLSAIVFPPMAISFSRLACGSLPAKRPQANAPRGAS